MALHRLRSLFILAIFVALQNHLTMKSITISKENFEVLKLLPKDSRERVIYAVLKFKFDKEKEPLNIEEQKIFDLFCKKEQKPVKSTRFVKPTVEMVAEYCTERQNGVDPSKWWNHYEAKGWKIGNTPMKDWKAAVRTWEIKNSANVVDAKKPEHNIDFDKLVTFYEETFNHAKGSVMITDSIKQEYIKRINEGYTRQNIRNAMWNCKNNRFHIEQKYAICTLLFFAQKKTLDNHGTHKVNDIRQITPVNVIEN